MLTTTSGSAPSVWLNDLPARPTTTGTPVPTADEGKAVAIRRWLYAVSAVEANVADDGVKPATCTQALEDVSPTPPNDFTAPKLANSAQFFSSMLRLGFMLCSQGNLRGAADALRAAGDEQLKLTRLVASCIDEHYCE